MARSLRLVLLAVLLAAAAILVYRYRGHTDHSPSVVAEAPRAPIAVPGVVEPEEMLVEPFPKYSPTEPEKMLGDAMKEVRGNSNPNALSPSLNRILAEYPDFADGYAIRLGVLCSGKDRAAITRLGSSGCDAWTLARIAGHSSISMSRRYVHPSEDAVLAAMERLTITGCNFGSRPSLPSAKEDSEGILTLEPMYNYEQRARSSAG